MGLPLNVVHILVRLPMANFGLFRIRSGMLIYYSSIFLSL
jgi:hypothetical protein